MSTPPKSSLLTRLPPSPPTSPGLTNDSFDLDPQHDASPERVLGVRELIAMAKNKPKPRPMTRSIELLGELEDEPEDEPEDESGPSEETGVRPSLDIARQKNGPFARDVVINSWMIVGGMGWGDKVRVGSYVVYDIQVTLQSGAKINIHRRYNDFVALREDLDTRFPIRTEQQLTPQHLQQTIPPLPGKKHMHKFSPTFIAERQPRLQRFLRTVMLHPEMGRGGEQSVVGSWVTSKDLG